jgi:hypothetical protein
MIPKPDSMVPLPQTVGSDPVKERGHPDVHGTNTTFIYPIYSQEQNNDDWAFKRWLYKGYSSFLPELNQYVRDDGAIHLPFNGLIYLPLIPRAYDPAWGQWQIPWYQHKKWVIRECIVRFENRGAPAVSGSIITWTVSVNDNLEPEVNPMDGNDCVEFSAATPYQWSVPISAFGPTEKYVIAPPEKKTRTGEVDGPVICLLVQLFD